MTITIEQLAKSLHKDTPLIFQTKLDEYLTPNGKDAVNNTYPDVFEGSGIQRTLLMGAARLGYVEKFKILISRGANVNQKADRRAYSALTEATIIAIAGCCTEEELRCKANEANQGTEEWRGFTDIEPFVTLYTQRKLELLELLQVLLENGANPNLKEYNGAIALDIAQRNQLVFDCFTKYARSPSPIIHSPMPSPAPVAAPTSTPANTPASTAVEADCRLALCSVS